MREGDFNKGSRNAGDVSQDGFDLPRRMDELLHTLDNNTRVPFHFKIRDIGTLSSNLFSSSHHQNMQTKKVPCWKGKPVLVSVYVERPKRRPPSLTHHHHYHHHHHHHVHHAVNRKAISHRGGAGGKGYTTSRRAELLQYSQRLRQSARTAPASPPPSTPYLLYPNQTSNPQPQAEIVTVPTKPKNSKAPTCFGNCKIPTIFGPLTSLHAKIERKTRKNWGSNVSNKINAAIKTLKVQKQHGFFCKLFSSSANRKRK